VDTTNKTLRVFDGTTLGGHRLLRDHCPATDVVLGRASPGPGLTERLPCTAAGRALLAGADVAAQRATLGIPAAMGLADFWEETHFLNAASDLNACWGNGAINGGSVQGVNTALLSGWH